MKLYFYNVLIFFSVATLFSCNKDKANPAPSSSTYIPQKRVYYISADEVFWDYAPKGYNVFTGMPFDMTDSVYAVNSTNRIGRLNWKAQYREYTDATFTELKTTTTEWKHLGILGPVIRAVVGDSIIVHFRNNTSFPTSLHAHGVLYDKSSEGAGYNDGTNGDGSSISLGDTYVYKYYARETSGPGEGEQSSKPWLYHSHVDMAEGDIYAGLVGTIIITDPKRATPDGRPNDVDKEFVTLFMVMDENNSLLLDKNIAQFTPSVDKADEDFQEGNKKHSINGMFMGNLPGLEMKMNDRVRWYVLTLGNEVDNHTPHWHGNTVSIGGERTDVIELMPASMKVADMTPDNKGIWAFHCHVTDHMMAGMNALYEVK
jgi:FtsP/CotA-like multicopper oxidase with cupredoxin domain